MRVRARFARTLCECGWPVYAVTPQGVFLVGATSKRTLEYEVPDNTEHIIALKPTGSGLKFTVYNTKMERVGIIWYRSKFTRWEAWGLGADVRPAMEALARVLGTPPKPLNAPDYP